jgi:AraC family transcriptional regulator
VWEHLEASLTREELAAVAHLSFCHFARQLKAAIGLPLHHDVIMRRVELAEEFLRGDLPPTEVAACAGFSAQSQFSSLYQRLVGVTPGRFRTPTGIAERPQGPPKDRRATPLHFPMSKIRRAS